MTWLGFDVFQLNWSWWEGLSFNIQFPLIFAIRYTDFVIRMQLLLTFTQTQNAFKNPEVYTYMVSPEAKYFVKKKK